MSTTSAARSGKSRPSHWLDVIADPVRLQILRSLSQVADATASELANGSPVSHQTLRRHLEALEALEVINSRPGASDGETSGRPAARFSLSPEVRDNVRMVLGASPLHHLAA